MVPSGGRITEAVLFEPENDVAGYRIVRQYTLDGVPIAIDWTVRLPHAHRSVVFDMSVTNHGDRPLRLDQDRGNTHDGTLLVSKFGFGPISRAGCTNAPGSTENDTRSNQAENTPTPGSADRFIIQRRGERQFATQAVWKTFPNARWVTISDSVDGATLTFIAGTTAPKMVVINDNAIDYLVNEQWLSPDETSMYRFAITLHPSGQRPTVAESRRRSQAVRAYASEHLPPIES